MYGHTTEECALKKASYANAAGRNVEFLEETAEPKGETEEPTAGGAEQTAMRLKPVERERPIAVGETLAAAERPTPAPRSPPVVQLKAAERYGRAESPVTRQKAAKRILFFSISSHPR